MSGFFEELVNQLNNLKMDTFGNALNNLDEEEVLFKVKKENSENVESLLRTPKYNRSYENTSEFLNTVSSALAVPGISITLSLASAAISVGLAAVSLSMALLSPVFSIAFGLKRISNTLQELDTPASDSWKNYLSDLGKNALFIGKSAVSAAGFTFMSSLILAVVAAILSTLVVGVTAALLLISAGSAIAYTSEAVVRSGVTLGKSVMSFFSSKKLDQNDDELENDIKIKMHAVI